MSRVLKTQPLTMDAFAPFGDVLDCAGTPDKIIKGTFMCPSHPRFDECDIGGTGGGGNFGVLADIPVLVR